MISILLIILKIIGITLLVILGILLLLFLLVLFVPVRYRFKGNYNESFYCTGKITWLLHFVSIKIEVEKEVVTSIRISGIPLSVFLKKKKEDVSQVESERSIKKEQTQVKTVEQIEEKPQETVIEETVLDDTVESAEKAQTKKISFVQKIANRILNIFNSIKQKIQDIIEKIKNVIAKIKDFIRNIKEKKKQLKRYLKILQSDTTKAAFALCKNKIFKMLKHIFPRKLHADITFGFEDPATTGYTLAVYGMLPAYVGKSIILHPDFDKQILQGKFKVKGAIRAWTLLYQLLSILIDKNCRKLYHVVKKEISNEHK